jgi:hypothetical protein
MDIRKIAAAAALASGAALALAPLASADPVDLTSTVSSEIASLNSSFSFEALLAGDSSDVIAPSAIANPLYDTIPLSFAPDTGSTPTTFGEYLYGVDSIAQAGSQPGAYDLFNGATGEFYNAFNTELYVLDGGTGLAPSTDLLGTGDLASALSSTTVAGELASFWDAGVSDLAGYFDAGNSLSFLDLTPTVATDTTNFLTELATLF